MDVKTLGFHSLCALVFVTCGIASHGNLNAYAILCTLAVVAQGAFWTGILGSVFGKKK